MLSPWFENAVEVDEFDHYFAAEDGLDENEKNVQEVADIDGESSETFRSAKEAYDTDRNDLKNITTETMARLASKSNSSYISDETQARNSFSNLSDVLNEGFIKTDDSDISNVINDSDSDTSLPATRFLVDINQFEQLKSLIEKYSDTTARQLAYISNDCKKLIQDLRKAGGSLTSEYIAEIRSIHQRLSDLSQILSWNNGTLIELRGNASRNFF